MHHVDHCCMIVALPSLLSFLPVPRRCWTAIPPCAHTYIDLDLDSAHDSPPRSTANDLSHCAMPCQSLIDAAVAIVRTVAAGAVQAASCILGSEGLDRIWIWTSVSGTASMCTSSVSVTVSQQMWVEEGEEWAMRCE